VRLHNPTIAVTLVYNGIVTLGRAQSKDRVNHLIRSKVVNTKQTCIYTTTGSQETMK
jgi:hypothetical protein